MTCPAIVVHDAHSHISIVPAKGNQVGQLREPAVPQALRATANLRRDLAAGTTTLRVMAEEHFLDADVRDAIEAGTVVGPRLALPEEPEQELRRPREACLPRDGPEAGAAESCVPTAHELRIVRRVQHLNPDLRLQ